MSGAVDVGIPSTWERAPLKHLVAVNREALEETTDPDFRFRYLDISSVDENGDIGALQELRFEDAPNRARRVVVPGDVIVSTVRTYLRAIARIPENPRPLICSTGFATLRPLKLDSGYLYWWTRSSLFVEEVVARSEGVSYPAISPLELGSISTPLPPIQEQWRIAHFLDRETARIDELMLKKRLVLERARERAESFIDNLLDGVRSASRRLKFFVTKIGSGKTPRGGADGYVEKGTLFLRSQNVLMGMLDLNDVAYIASDVDEEMRSTRVHPFDILLNITGASIGRTCLAPPELGSANINQHVCIVRPIASVNPEILYYNLRSPRVQSQIRESQVGGNREGLNFEQVGNLLVRVPVDPRDVSSLLHELRDADFWLKRFQAAVDWQLKSLSERKQSLINAAVTGQLNIAKTS